MGYELGLTRSEDDWIEDCLGQVVDFCDRVGAVWNDSVCPFARNAANTAYQFVRNHESIRVGAIASATSCGVHLFTQWINSDTQIPQENCKLDVAAAVKTAGLAFLAVGGLFKALKTFHQAKQETKHKPRTPGSSQ